ncbi:MAG: cysteine desulfurase [Spirochaetales bacterium]|nr:MAG: cysteine desulfurase [Spirochaetales bacterium]
MHFIYLDWAATAMPDPESLKIFTETAVTYPANPSSAHGPGRDSAGFLSELRSSFAGLLDCGPESIVFTSSGTESNNIVFTSLLSRAPSARRRNSIVLSGIEHAAVYGPASLLRSLGYDVRLVNTEPNGVISADKFLAHADETTVLASVMHVNNETGSIQPVAEIAEGLRGISSRYGNKIHFHVDAVQSFGKIPFFPVKWHIDSAAVSGHKIGASRGAGILYTAHPLPALYRGGDQEQGMRPGTENLAGSAAFYHSARAALESLGERAAHASSLSRHLREKLADFPECRPFPGFSEENYSPYIVTVFFPPLPGEVLVRCLSDEGVAVSTGSACSTRKKGHTRVMEAMMLPKSLAASALRASFGPATSMEDIEGLMKALHKTVPGLLRIARN